MKNEKIKKNEKEKGKTANAKVERKKDENKFFVVEIFDEIVAIWEII